MTLPAGTRLEELVALVREGRTDAFIQRAWELEPADLADVLSALDEAERLKLVRVLPVELSSQALVEMPYEEHAEDIVAALDAAQAAEIVSELEDDDAADLLGELDHADQERILSAVEDRADVDRLLGYHEETAGGLMTLQLVTVTDLDTVGLALEAVRRQADDVEDVTEIFVVDTARRLAGLLTFKQLVLTPTDRLVREVMDDTVASVLPDVDQEEVARLMARYNLPSIPVVDTTGRLLGRVTYDDVIDVTEAEATEDLLRFGGVSPDEELGGTSMSAVKSRLPWLYTNLLTAFPAATMMVLFERTTMHPVGKALLPWVPVIAGMGGNAGTQALAVSVRRLSLGNVNPARFASIVRKEMLVGAINGLAIGVVVAFIAIILGGPWRLGLVVFLAMAGNLFVAGFAGSFIPVMLERLGVDPAIASSIFVTTLTDAVGLGLLLGLGTMVFL